jgi:hypothetical protein
MHLKFAKMPPPKKKKNISLSIQYVHKKEIFLQKNVKKRKLKICMGFALALAYYHF